MVGSMPTFEIVNDRDFNELIDQHLHESFMLLVIGSRLGKTPPGYPQEVGPNEAVLNSKDFGRAGLSMQNYRTASRHLEQWGFIEIVATRYRKAGTLIRLPDERLIKWTRPDRQSDTRPRPAIESDLKFYIEQKIESALKKAVGTTAGRGKADADNQGRSWDDLSKKEQGNIRNLRSQMGMGKIPKAGTKQAKIWDTLNSETKAQQIKWIREKADQNGVNPKFPDWMMNSLDDFE